MLAQAGIRPTHVLWHQGESDVVAEGFEGHLRREFDLLL